jgi:Pyruvate/2-oxoacid:ferredoxin oxidoreductase delta subunit
MSKTVQGDGNIMLRVRKDLCVGCGLCRENCPQEAVSVQSGKAWIDQTRCKHCGICVDICPQVAIVESAPVSQAELAITVGSLKQKANDLIGRIEKLKQNMDNVT